MSPDKLGLERTYRQNIIPSNKFILDLAAAFSALTIGACQDNSDGYDSSLDGGMDFTDTYSLGTSNQALTGEVTLENIDCETHFISLDNDFAPTFRPFLSAGTSDGSEALFPLAYQYLELLNESGTEFINYTAVLPQSEVIELNGNLTQTDVIENAIPVGERNSGTYLHIPELETYLGAGNGFVFTAPQPFEYGSDASESDIFDLDSDVYLYTVTPFEAERPMLIMGSRDGTTVSAVTYEVVGGALEYTHTEITDGLSNIVSATLIPVTLNTFGEQNYLLVLESSDSIDPTVLQLDPQTLELLGQSSMSAVSRNNFVRGPARDFLRGTGEFAAFDVTFEGVGMPFLTNYRDSFGYMTFNCFVDEEEVVIEPDAGHDADAAFDSDAGPNLDTGTPDAIDIEISEDTGPNLDTGTPDAIDREITEDTGPNLDTGTPDAIDREITEDTGPNLDTGTPDAIDIEISEDTGPNLDTGTPDSNNKESRSGCTASNQEDIPPFSIFTFAGLITVIRRQKQKIKAKKR
jgi:hypothetical protein